MRFLDLYDYDGPSFAEMQKAMENMENMKSYMQSLVQQIFGDGDIDEDKMFEDVDQLCCYLSMPFKGGDINVQRKKHKENQFIEAINFFNNYTVREQKIC